MTDTFVPVVPEILSVAYRCLALWALFSRANTEVNWEYGQDYSFAEGNKAHIEQWHWLMSTGLSQHLTRTEHDLLMLPFGHMAHELKVYCLSSIYSIQAFLWALSWIDDLPRVSGDPDLDAVNFDETFLKVNFFVNESALRSVSALVKERNIQMAYARRFQLQQSFLKMHGRGSSKFLRKGLGTLMAGVQAACPFPDTQLAGDLPVINQIDLSNLDTVMHAHTMSYYRLWALDWMLGQYPDWDHYPHPTEMGKPIWMKL